MIARKTSKAKGMPVNRTRITVGVWDQLIKLINQEMAKACLRRDAYLDRVLAYEVGMLEQEVEKPN